MELRSLNWSHAIIGFLIGVAIILYLRGEAKAGVSVQDPGEIVEVQTE